MKDNNAGGGFVGDADAVGIQVSRYESEDSSGASCSGGIYSTFDDVSWFDFWGGKVRVFFSDPVFFFFAEKNGEKTHLFFFFFSFFRQLQVCIPLPPYATRSGPRKTIYADPATTTAAIVTCGGLCPGELFFFWKKREREREEEEEEEEERETREMFFCFSSPPSSSPSLSLSIQTQASTTSSRTSSSPSRTTASLRTRSSGSATASAGSTPLAAARSAAAASRSSFRERQCRGST